MDAALTRRIETDPRVLALAQSRKRGSLPGWVLSADLRQLGYDVPEDFKYTSGNQDVGGRMAPGAFEETTAADKALVGAGLGMFGLGAGLAAVGGGAAAGGGSAAVGPSTAGNIAATATGAGIAPPASLTAGGGLSGVLGGLTQSPYAKAALAGLGGILNNRAGARTSTNAPTFAPEFTGLRDLLVQQTQNRLSSGGLPAGYEAGGIQNINQIAGLVNQSKQNDLTSRGLGTSPVAASVFGRGEDARASDIAQFTNSLPLVQRQMQNEDLGLASHVLGLGRGQTNVGAGSAAGAGFTDAASMLAWLTAQQQKRQRVA